MVLCRLYVCSFVGVNQFWFGSLVRVRDSVANIQSWRHRISRTIFCLLVLVFLSQCHWQCATCRNAENRSTSVWDSQHLSDSPLDSLLAEINRGKTPETRQYFHHLARIDSQIFLDTPRDRVYILLVHADLGAAVMDRAVEILNKFLLQSTTHPVVTPWQDLLLPETSPFLAKKLSDLQAGPVAQ